MIAIFKHAIVKKPSETIVGGITSSPELGRPDYKLVLEQHKDYIKALEYCGLKVVILEADERYPDSCFVEDTAVLSKDCAIITNLGAKSRKGEEKEIVDIIKIFYPENKIEYIKSPGTIEGGDVMMVGDHFYIGLSNRTNQEGVNQFIKILEKNGLTGSEVEMKNFLHLKTGSSYLENNNLLVSGEFIEKPIFKEFNKISVKDYDQYSSNSLWINGKVIVAKGYETTKKKIEDLGYEVVLVDTSEFKKIDGGLSCLSLRF